MGAGELCDEVLNCLLGGINACRDWWDKRSGGEDIVSFRI